VPEQYTHTVEVERPVREVYDQWTQMEDFPHFMHGVERVEQITDTQMRWHVSIAGVDRTFDAVISEQVPDELIAWGSLDGPQQDGVVTFRSLGPDRTQVSLAMTFEPDGLVEKAGDALGFVERRVKGDLERFKDFIESRDAATGEWRGTVAGGVEQGDMRQEGIQPGGLQSGGLQSGGLPSSSAQQDIPGGTIPPRI
jgi:uncharacterized membrane protein